MGLLDKLWDDTLAGPQPESGLGRLRKHPSLQAGRRSSAAGSDPADGGSEEAPRVTRSIMIKRPPGWVSTTQPSSPAGSTPPLSPFASPSGGGGKEWNRFRRNSLSDAYARGGGGEGSSYPPFEV